MVEKISTEVPRLIIPTITILLVFYRFAPLFACNVFIKNLFFGFIQSVALCRFQIITLLKSHFRSNFAQN